jgi:hypothetical protein
VCRERGENSNTDAEAMDTREDETRLRITAVLVVL